MNGALTDDDLKTRATLLIRIRDAADGASWSEFVELYTPLIYRFCASRGVAEADIPDVTQETMRRVATAIRKFEYDPERGKFRSWLFQVTYSRLARHFEKKNRQPQGSGRTTVHRMLEETPSEQVEADWDLEYRRQMFDWAAERVKAEFEEQNQVYLATGVVLDTYQVFSKEPINSLSDMAIMVLGFMIAASAPVWVSVSLFIVAELVVGLIIRDGLILNVIMLLYPLDWIRQWQNGQ